MWFQTNQKFLTLNTIAYVMQICVEFWVIEKLVFLAREFQDTGNTYFLLQ